MILFRYILREYLVPLFYCLTGFLAIYVLFELFGSFSRIVEAKLPFMLGVRYFLGYIAPFFHYLAPAALMLAALYTMWNFCRHSELIAMRANGIGFFAISAPILLTALAMTVFVAWVNESYVPRTAQWAKRLRAEHFDLEKTARSGSIVYRNAAGERTWSADTSLDPDGHHLSGVKVVQDRPGGAREFLLASERADWMDGEWWFSKPNIRHYDISGGETATPTPDLDKLPLRVFAAFGERPADIMAQNRDWKYNSVRGKLRYLQTNKELSESSRRSCAYETWAQLMSPLACIIITLFAIPAGVSSGRQSVFLGILAAIGMFFAFYAFVIAGMVAADMGFVPPFLAAIVPYILFFVLGVRSFRRQK